MLRREETGGGGVGEREEGVCVCACVCVGVCARVCVDACVCDPTLSGLVCLVIQSSVLMVNEY